MKLKRKHIGKPCFFKTVNGRLEKVRILTIEGEMFTVQFEKNNAMLNVSASSLIPKKDVTTCEKCRTFLVPSQKHSCGYEIEINDNNNPEYCNCCPNCEYECGRDV